MTLVNALSDDNDTKSDRQTILVFAHGHTLGGCGGVSTPPPTLPNRKKSV